MGLSLASSILRIFHFVHTLVTSDVLLKCDDAAPVKPCTLCASPALVQALLGITKVRRDHGETLRRKMSISDEAALSSKLDEGSPWPDVLDSSA
ncbi:hypothetical protein BDR04DRAFT_1102557 [Suillus decipiens]|nr:hypothetical protein BDR04DRAFT_1102557 [Suillus decipiens]